MRIGLKGGSPQGVEHADAAQHARRVRQHLDAGADAGELPRLLVDLHVGPGRAQGCGGGKPAHAGPDDGHRRLLRHSVLLQRPMLLADCRL
jgi:hypothetical protein